jgi:integrase
LAEWSEIGLEAGLWTIPAERVKAKREHWVPLSTQAIALLKKLPRIEGNNYLFLGGKVNRPLSDMTLSAAIRRFNECKEGESPVWIDPTCGKEIVPHGFRSTFRDWSAEVGHYPREVAEHALAHSLPNKVEASYHRGSMLERRRAMMQEWADYLDKLKAGAESIPLHEPAV